MNRDPFYNDIINRLEGELDWYLFQDCASDILRDIYPTLVPIHGGSDEGMDGAIADSEGEPFQLISTTRDDAIGNLTDNLTSYIEKGGTRRKAVFATPRKLTPRKRKNLNERAKELDFILIQIFDQTAIANLLYHHPEWCMELLNLSGDPPALSTMPRTNRPLLSLPLMGRNDARDWLSQTEGDRLLIGQPGSGKTFLLHKFVQAGRGLFLVDKDRGNISAGIRSQQPSSIVIDDAHIHVDLLTDLLQIRSALGAKFDIIASCWPGEHNEIEEILQLQSSSTHTLQLLTRSEIVEVIQAAGMKGPNALVREIVDQAEGRPGLAVTLVHFCLHGDIENLVQGNILSRSVIPFFERQVGHEASVILAGFAIGGDTGMSIKAVAHSIGKHWLEVRNAVTRLAVGGIVHILKQNICSVRPPVLRFAIIRDVFFGQLPIQIEPFLAQVEDLDNSVITLIGAKARGATISDNLLLNLVERTNSLRIWEMYAYLGLQEAEVMVRKHPEAIVHLARPSLQFASNVALPLLLKYAVGDNQALHSHPEHPLRLIQDWIQEPYPGSGHATKRRTHLLDSIEEWFASDGDLETIIKALTIVISPKFENYSIDPGSSNKGTLEFGILSLNEMMQIQELWSRVLEIVRRVPHHIMKFQPIINDWLFPGNIDPPEETAEFMFSFAEQMIRDLVQIGKDAPHTLHWIRELTSRWDLEVNIPVNPLFEVFFPVHELDDWRKAEKEQRKAVDSLASKWVKENPETIVRQVVDFETEAALAGLNWPRWTPRLCHQIASLVDTPSLWVQAMSAREANSDLILPFLRRTLELKEPGWKELAFTCLSNTSSQRAIIEVVLTSTEVIDDLLDAVFDVLEDCTWLVETVVLRYQIPENTVLRLLQHPNSDVTIAAAKGEWIRDSKGNIRESLFEDWKHVVVNYVDDEHWLFSAFLRFPEMAFDWLRIRINDDPRRI